MPTTTLHQRDTRRERCFRRVSPFPEHPTRQATGVPAATTPAAGSGARPSGRAGPAATPRRTAGRAGVSARGPTSAATSDAGPANGFHSSVATSASAPPRMAGAAAPAPGWRPTSAIAAHAGDRSHPGRSDHAVWYGIFYTFALGPFCIMTDGDVVSTLQGSASRSCARGGHRWMVRSSTSCRGVEPRNHAPRGAKDGAVSDPGWCRDGR